MNPTFDLLPVPAERDFPAESLAARRDALVMSISAEQQHSRAPLRAALRSARSHISRVWLALIAVFVAVLALALSSLSGYQSRGSTTTETLIAVAGATQIITVLAAPATRDGVRLGGQVLTLRSREQLAHGVIAAA
jgi:hypothetical protein